MFFRGPQTRLDTRLQIEYGAAVGEMRVCEYVCFFFPFWEIES